MITIEFKLKYKYNLRKNLMTFYMKLKLVLLTCLEKKIDIEYNKPQSISLVKK